MTTYRITFVHPIAGACPDATIKCDTLNPGDFADKALLAKELRARGILVSGQSIRELRVLGSSSRTGPWKAVVLPTRKPGGWHSITLTAEG